SIIDAGHFDTQTAYAAVNTFRLDDLSPHIFRTHDGGKTWTEIVNGIPKGAAVNVVREDPKCKGLLFAGTETQVWVSFDDGDHWSSLRLNMPATSIRDLIIKNDDIAVGTHGRSFWILDDIAPLRQLTPATREAPAVLFKPAAAYRFRWSKYTDTPVPPDEPSGQNPPDGAIIDYFVGPRAMADAKLEIIDPSANGRVIRTYSSSDTAMPPADIGNTPWYWIRPTKVLSAEPGFHRFVWDLHYAPPAGTSSRPGEYPISATPYDTPREPRGPWAAPGQYIVRLTIGGHSYIQPLTITMDPRVKTPPAEIARMHATAVTLYDDIAKDSAATAAAHTLQARVAAVSVSDASAKAALAAFEDKLSALVGQSGGGRRGGRGRGGAAQPSLGSMSGDLLGMMQTIEQSDMAPTSQTMQAVARTEQDFAGVMARWNALRTTELAAVNAKLKAAGGSPIGAP
ncbi:MAG TPA: hypothetical protein VHB25_03980, partial [Gemmatimonadaceae bacterium]|nr:hypothetical protein [Gemmatimonadaceae bacterium]